MRHNGVLDMDTQEKTTMGSAITPTTESQSVINLFAVSLMCWRMKYSTLAFQTLQKSQSMKQPELLMMYIVLFPNAKLPDTEDDWEEEEEIYK